MSSRPRVVLVGPMGAGKTTVAEVLGTRWDLPVRDTDRDVEASAGKPISEIFVDDGEALFRVLERTAVAEALAGHEGVLALGGGAVLDPDTRRSLQGHQVVFLRVGLAEAIKRVGMGAGRPLLFGNVRARIKALLDERDPVYREVARIVVDTSDLDPESVADQVVEALLVDEQSGQGTP